jgi:hypothetical protein
MSESITRDDAVLAARLWGLASRRYETPSVLPLHGPDPVSLYAGFESTGCDPVEALTALATELGQLADTWASWHQSGPEWPVREGGHPELPQLGVTVLR